MGSGFATGAVAEGVAFETVMADFWQALVRCDIDLAAGLLSAEAKVVIVNRPAEMTADGDLRTELRTLCRNGQGPLRLNTVISDAANRSSFATFAVAACGSAPAIGFTMHAHVCAGQITAIYAYLADACADAATDLAVPELGRPELSRFDLENLTLARYFAAIDGKDLAGAMACFAPDATFAVRTAGARFEGRAEIARMLADYFTSFAAIAHRDFAVTIDVARQCVAARFQGVIRAADNRETRLTNTNFWRVRDGLFVEVAVYMSGENVLI